MEADDVFLHGRNFSTCSHTPSKTTFYRFPLYQLPPEAAARWGTEHLTFIVPFVYVAKDIRSVSRETWRCPWSRWHTKTISRTRRSSAAPPPKRESSSLHAKRSLLSAAKFDLISRPHLEKVEILIISRSRAAAKGASLSSPRINDAIKVGSLPPSSYS